MPCSLLRPPRIRPLTLRHHLAYRAAHNPIVPPPLEVDARAVYHALCPLPCLSPVPQREGPAAILAEQEANEAAYRQLLVQGVLAVLLPTEDLENDCLTALVGQIFSETVIGGVVANKAAEPWLIYEGLIILSRVIRQKIATGPVRTADSPESAEAGLLTRRLDQPRRRTSTNSVSIQGLFWTIMRLAFAAFAFVKLLVATIIMSRSLPSRRGTSSRPGTAQHGDVTRHKDDMVQKQREAKAAIADPAWDGTGPGNTAHEATKVPLLAFRIWPTISHLVELDVRMPWVGGALAMLQWLAMTGPGRIAGVDGILDR